jgi:hypothetical protein
MRSNFEIKQNSAKKHWVTARKQPLEFGAGTYCHSRLSKKKGLYFCHHPQWRGLPMQTNIESLKQRIDQLHLEHRDLDDVIARLAEKPGQDQLQLQRLKKKKLLIKDQISHLERQLTPDIRA